MTLRAAALVLILLQWTHAATPISLHPANRHYFLFRGKPIALVTSAEHYGSVLNADFDYKKYLAALSAAGMNYTRLFGGSYVEVPAKSFGIRRNTLAPASGRFIAPWTRSATPGYAGGGNKFDLANWNPEYFTRLHDFLAGASQRGIIVEITLFTSHYQEAQWAISPLNPANNTSATDSIEWKKLHTLDNGNLLAHQERYARKLVREVNSFDNVIIEIQNEPWSDRPVLSGVMNPYLQAPARDRYPNSIDLPDDLSMAWQARVASWISSEESSLPNKHLIAQNCCNFGFPVRSLAPGVSVVNFHYAYPAAVTDNYGLDKALVYDETGFLGSVDDKYARQAWNFMMAGGSGFNSLDYSFTVGHEDGTDTEPNGPGGGSVALRKQLRVLADLLHSMPLTSVQPDSKSVKHAAGCYARVLSSANDYAMYFEGSGPASVTLALPAGQYTGRWINTQTGTVERLEKFRHSGGQRVVDSPEFQSSIALRLKRN